MIEKPKRPKKPDIQERQPPRTLQELISRYDLDNTKIYDFLDGLVELINTDISNIEEGINELDTRMTTNLNKIEDRLKTFFIPINVDNIAGWHLALSGTVSTYNNNAFKLSVTNLFSNNSGILYANIRRDNGGAFITNFKWETNTGINSYEWKLKIDGNNYYLYCWTNFYAQYQIKVLQSSDLMNDNEEILTFYTPIASDTVPEPTGIIPDYKNECIIDLGNGVVTSNDLNNPITITNINFDELEAITFQFGNPTEGDSKTILISNNGEILNDVVHLDMYADTNYYCKAFAYVAYSSGHIGYAGIILKQLMGWSMISYKIRGIKRY